MLSQPVSYLIYPFLLNISSFNHLKTLAPIPRIENEVCGMLPDRFFEKKPIRFYEIKLMFIHDTSFFERAIQSWNAFCLDRNMKFHYALELLVNTVSIIDFIVIADDFIIFDPHVILCVYCL